MSASTAVEECERAIRRALLAGDYAPGERLPPERTLAESLGVNRTTLRAALGRLASARLLTVRQGSGYVVHDFRLVSGLELLPDLAELAVERGEGLGPMFADLLEVRRRLAAMALERLACRGAEGALEAAPIREAVKRFVDLVEDDASVDELADADVAIMAAILRATGSRVLGLIINPVSLVVRDLTALRAAIYRDPRGNALAYRLLLAWLEAPNAAAIPTVLGILEERDAETVALVAPPAIGAR